MAAKDDDVEAEVEAFRAKLLAKKGGGGDEVWVRHPDSGAEVKISGERATNVLAKFGDLFDAPAAPDGDDGDGDGDTPPKGTGVFGKRLGK